MWKNLHGGTTGFSLLGAWWESPQLTKNLLILSLTKFLSPHIKGSPSPPLPTLNNNFYFNFILFLHTDYNSSSDSNHSKLANL